MVKWSYEKMITQQNGTTHFLMTDKKNSRYLDESTWHVNKDGHTYYARTNTIQNGRKTTMSFHRLIMGLLSNDTRVIDHLNHNGLDNRECNLEIKSRHENMLNRQIDKNNSSGTTGVSWHNNNKRWQAFIRFNGTQIHLGYFKEKDDAIKARKDAEKKYFGEHSYDACQSKNNIAV